MLSCAVVLTKSLAGAPTAARIRATCSAAHPRAGRGISNVWPINELIRAPPAIREQRLTAAGSSSGHPRRLYDAVDDQEGVYHEL
jgi:hypothetical protein